jgi:uncharacterized phage protein (TIGR02216 family)
MPTSDGWDWPFLLYTATVILRRSEAQFWRMTPRKLNALTRVHAEVNDPESGKKKKKDYPRAATGFIDQVM